MIIRTMWECARFLVSDSYWLYLAIISIKTINNQWEKVYPAIKLTWRNLSIIKLKLSYYSWLFLQETTWSPVWWGRANRSDRRGIGWDEFDDSMQKMNIKDKLRFYFIFCLIFYVIDLRFWNGLTKSWKKLWENVESCSDKK